MKKESELLYKHVVLKSDSIDSHARLKTMIQENACLQIVSESDNQIVVISTHKAKPLQELFPQITPIKSRKNRSVVWGHRIRKNHKKTNLEIVNMSGLLFKKG